LTPQIGIKLWNKISRFSSELNLPELLFRVSVNLLTEVPGAGKPAHYFISSLLSKTLEKPTAIC